MQKQEKPETPENESAPRSSHCSPSQVEDLRQRLMDEFAYKRNVLDAVQAGKSVRQVIDAIPSRSVCGELYQWLQGVHWFLRDVDRKKSDLAYDAAKMVIERARKIEASA